MAAKTKDIESGKISKKPTYPGFWNNLLEYFSDFSQCTSIHAVRHLGSKRLSIVEKLFWLMTITISVMLCSLLILKFYNKWVSTPVIVTFAKTTTPIWKIPFPAVTVCTETKAKQTIYNYTDIYHKFQDEPQNISEEDMKKFEEISLICNNYPYTKGRKVIDSDVIDFYSKLKKVTIRNYITVPPPQLIEDYVVMCDHNRSAVTGLGTVTAKQNGTVLH